MSETMAQHQMRLNEEQRRAIQMMMANQARQITRGCTTDDEKYERIRDSVGHDMIWRMTHGPQ